MWPCWLVYYYMLGDDESPSIVVESTDGYRIAFLVFILHFFFFAFYLSIADGWDAEYRLRTPHPYRFQPFECYHGL